MKRAVSTLLVGFTIVAAAGIMTEVSERMNLERLKARQAVSSSASQFRGDGAGNQKIKVVVDAAQP